MHVHVLNHPWDEAGNIRPRWDRQGVVEMLGMLLDAGVTTIRDPGSETEAAVTWRAALARGEVRGPRLFTAGRIINASDFDPEPFLPVHSEDEARREVRWQAALGVDAVKVYSIRRRRSSAPWLTRRARQSCRSSATCSGPRGPRRPSLA